MWVKILVDKIGLYDLNIFVRVDVVVDVGMLLSYKVLVGFFSFCFLVFKRLLLWLLDLLSDNLVMVCGRLLYFLLLEIWMLEVVMDLLSLEGVG